MAKTSGKGAYQTGQNHERAGFWDHGRQSQLGNVVRKSPLVEGERKGSEEQRDEKGRAPRHLPKGD